MTDDRPIKERIAEQERRLDAINHEITAAEWGDDHCCTNGKMDRLQQQKNQIVYTLSSLKAAQDLDTGAAS